jgi:hypothetical protein
MTTLRREDLVRALPYARRYARALTGSQPRGDGLVAASLQALLAEPSADGEPRHMLYRGVTRRFNAELAEDAPPAGLSAKQRWRQRKRSACWATRASACGPPPRRTC